MLIEQQQISGRVFLHIFRWGHAPEIIDTFRPYCYIPASEASLAPRSWTVDDWPHRTIDGDKVLKAVADLPQEIRDNRDRFTSTWESDVPFTQRYMLDHITTPIEEKAPRLVIIDIETAQKGSFVGAREASAPVISITVHCSSGYVTFAWRADFPERQAVNGSDDWEIFLFNSEALMLSTFLAWWEKERPEVVSGWNSDAYDMPYLIHRMQKNGLHKLMAHLSPMRSVTLEDDDDSERDIKVVIKGVAIFDLLRAYRKYRLRRQRSYRLGDVAAVELDSEKVKLDSANMADAWAGDWRRVLFYNKRDVELVVQLEAKLRIIDYYIEVHHISGCEFMSSIYVASATEAFMMKRVGMVVNNKHKQKGESIEGADIIVPDKGVHHGIVALDLKGMYTANLCAINASFETWRSLKLPNKERLIKLDDETAFVSHSVKKGRLSLIIEELMASKSEYDKKRKAAVFGTLAWEQSDRRRYGYKQMLNTVFGLCAQPNSRFYNKYVARAVTLFGRMVIGAVKSYLKSEPLIYSHTDSVYLAYGVGLPLDVLIAKGTALEAEVNGYLLEWGNKLGIEPKHNTLNIEFQEIADAGIFDKKNRYALRIVWREGHVIDPPEIESVGIDAVRSDCPAFAADLQEEVIALIMNGVEEKALYEHINRRMSAVERGEVPPLDLAVKKGISKAPDKYETAQPWHRGAIYANRYMGKSFGAGSNPRYVRVSAVPEGYPPTDVVCIEDDDDLKGFTVDVKAMRAVTMKKLDGVLRAVGWSTRRLDGERTLDDWGEAS